MSKKFKKYMTPYTLGWKLGTALSVFIIAMFLGLMVQENEFSFAPLVVFGVLLAVCLAPLFRANRFFKQMESQNINAIEADFARAYPFVKGKVRVGQTYIFAKASGKLVKFTDMIQVYQYIHRSNGIEDKRLVKYVDANGKHRDLCQLRLKGKSDSELKDILHMIQQKNPTIKIGV